MKVIELPDELPQGNLLFAPRLAPRVLLTPTGGLDLGLSEFTNMALGRLRGVMACVMEMRGAPLQVLLLFVKDSRPLMVQAAKLRLGSFELEEARPPECLRILVLHLGELAPHLVVDDATHSFLKGAALPEIGARIVDAATTFGGLLPKEQPGGIDEEARKSSPGGKAEESPPKTDPSQHQEKTASAESPREEAATPAAPASPPSSTSLGELSDRVAREIAANSSIIHVPPATGARAPTTTEEETAASGTPRSSLLWLDAAQQCLLADAGDAVLVARSQRANLEMWAQAIEAGKSPQIVLGSDALTIPLASLRRVENLQERRRLVMVFEGEGGVRKERIAYSDREAGNRLFGSIERLLPTWRRQHRILSIRSALLPLLTIPAVLTGLWLVLLVLALRSQEEGVGRFSNPFGPLAPEGAVMAGLAVLALAFLPALRRLLHPPPECEELVPADQDAD
jgi:hypothetical protein